MDNSTSQALTWLVTSALTYVSRQHVDEYKRILTQLFVEHTTSLPSCATAAGRFVSPRVESVQVDYAGGSHIAMCNMPIISFELPSQYAVTPTFSGAGGDLSVFHVDRIPNVYERYPLLTLYKQTSQGLTWANEVLAPWLTLAAIRQVVQALPITALYRALQNDMPDPFKHIVARLTTRPYKPLSPTTQAGNTGFLYEQYRQHLNRRYQVEAADNIDRYVEAFVNYFEEEIDGIEAVSLFTPNAMTYPFNRQAYMVNTISIHRHAAYLHYRHPTGEFKDHNPYKPYKACRQRFFTSRLPLVVPPLDTFVADALEPLRHETTQRNAQLIAAMQETDAYIDDLIAQKVPPLSVIPPEIYTTGGLSELPPYVKAMFALISMR